MSYGYMGTILRIDLTNQKITFQKLEDHFYRRYFGGRGFISYFLLTELDPGTDPLSPKNKLIFACGPVTGAPFSGSGRHSIGAKSPLTGYYGESEAGGYWGAELKKAGFDAIIIEGKASTPSYIWIHNDKVEIRDANHVWGKEIREASKILQIDVNDKLARTAIIGPGGENLVRYATITNGLNHTAGRCGMGAVMGSKNLKAIVVRGSHIVPVAHPQDLQALAKWMAINVDKVSHAFHTYGTGAAMDVFEEIGNLPVRNFRDGVFPGVEKISAKAVKAKVSVGMGTCFACVVRCKKEVKIGEPWNVDPAYGGPEYETLAALGSNCGIDNLEAICKANELCQKYGIDTISTGVSISFAMECYEHRLLSLKDLGNIPLTFGNTQAMLHLIKLIGKREGIGNLLAEGVKRASEQIGQGADHFAIHVKGQELPMHEPNAKNGLGLGYAVSPTGADHMHNIHDTAFNVTIPKKYQNLGLLKPVPAKDLSPNKVRLFKYAMTLDSLDNCLVMCMFPNWTAHQKVEIIRAITGWNTSLFELMKVSERAINLTRIYNLREGATMNEDWLPERFFTPKTDGPLADTAISPEEFKNALLTYYSMMGWTRQGIPKQTTLEELNIGWVSKYL